MTYYYTAIVTLLAIALYFVFATRVAAARGKFGVKLPATTGNPDFERVYRAHVNAGVAPDLPGVALADGDLSR